AVGQLDDAPHRLDGVAAVERADDVVHDLDARVERQCVAHASGIDHGHLNRHACSSILGDHTTGGTMPQRHPELTIPPTRRENGELGAAVLRTPEAVDAFLDRAKSGTAMVVINSVCGCSAGTMRPGLAMALEQGPKPEAIGQVFAGA